MDKIVDSFLYIPRIGGKSKFRENTITDKTLYYLLDLLRMLSKKYRLTKKEFHSIFQSSRAFRFPYFIIKYKASVNDYSRFAISCGLKVSKKAIERNTIKRRLFEIIRLHKATAPLGDYIVIVRPMPDVIAMKWELEVKNAFSVIGQHV